MQLVNVYDEPKAADILYELLRERDPETWISHKVMPSIETHKAFIASEPFLYWLLIKVQAAYVGAIEVTDRNELGIAILKRFRRHGYARTALNLFMREYQPLPAIPAVRNGNWLANISVLNEDSKAFFRKCGFGPLQETWTLYN